MGFRVLLSSCVERGVPPRITPPAASRVLIHFVSFIGARLPYDEIDIPGRKRGDLNTGSVW